MAFVERIAGAAALGVAILIGSGLSSPAARAAFIVTLAQVGSNVVATGSGTIDRTDLHLFESGFSDTIGIAPFQGAIVIGPASGSAFDGYSGFEGPTNFGNGGETLTTTGSGDFVGIGGNFDTLVVPAGYMSGNPLSDTLTYDDATFASLGLIPGSYVWTWGSGADADSFTIDIGTPVPEPSALTLLGTALAGLFLVGLWANRRDHRARTDLTGNSASA
jgi:PEP-CTERM motif